MGNNSFRRSDFSLGVQTASPHSDAVLKIFNTPAPKGGRSNRNPLPSNNLSDDGFSEHARASNRLSC